MDKKIKKYSVIGDESCVYAVSLVEEPAIESNFVCFSKDEKPKMEMKFYKEESENKTKYMVLGAVLIPDKEIYRNYDGQEFFITFSADAIEKLSQNYMRNLYGGGEFTLDHKEFTPSVFLCESWIKTTQEDKSNAYGFGDLPMGTWFISAKVDSIEVWNSIQEGTRAGFSVESFVELEEIITKTENTEMAKETQNVEANESFWERLTNTLKAVLSAEKPEVKLEEETPSEEEEKTPEEVAEEAAAVVEEQAENKEEEAEDLQAVVDALQAKVDELQAENEELKKKNNALAKTPSTKVNVKQGAAKQNPMDVVAALRNGTYFK